MVNAEERQVTTHSPVLLSVIIGKGTVLSGDFTAIDNLLERMENELE